MILIVIAVNTALLGQESPTLVLIEDAGAAGERVHMTLLRHNFTHGRHGLQKDAARNGRDEQWTFYCIIVDGASLEMSLVSIRNSFQLTCETSGKIAFDNNIWISIPCVDHMFFHPRFGSLNNLVRNDFSREGVFSVAVWSQKWKIDAEVMTGNCVG